MRSFAHTAGPLAAAVALFGASAQAGTISHELAQTMDAASPDDLLAVLIQLPDQFDTRALVATLVAEGADYATRHQKIMDGLQSHALASQAPYLGLLRAEELEDEITEVEPLWITNGFALRTTPAGVTRLNEIFSDAALELDQVELIEPVDRKAPSGALGVASREWGIEQIRAPALWEMGIFGQGTLVANLDTGVDGLHTALAERWRGNEPDVEWWHAWKAEDASEIPEDPDSHGTHTMGTMVGSTVGDTVGVAPAAKWIAARISLSGRPGVSVSIALQWCSDPDNNSSTVDDVPDAVNNSWGSTTQCTGQHWTTIDNMEALGPIACFSAGNSGPGAQTVGSPSNRATTHTQNFSVGATNNNEGIAGFSSRGPTRCNVADSLLFKPDVSAPGSGVRSTIPGNRYSSFSGTSMACPHVGGAIALLRQIYPAISPEEAKTLLYRSARHPQGAGNEDNNYGRGIIDVEAAANYLFSTLSLDGTLAGTVSDQASGAPLSGVRVEVEEALLAEPSDGNGDFSFHLLANDVTVKTDLIGYYPFSEIVTVPRGGEATLDIQMRELPYGEIGGTLTNGGGEGISASIDIYQEASDSLMASVNTDAAGAFTADLKIGSYRLSVQPAPPERFYSVTSVVVDSGMVSDVSAAVEAANVLLVDADGGTTDYDVYLLEAISGSGRSYNHFDRAKESSATDAIGRMPAESAVVWFSGDATEDIVETSEQDALIAFVEGGGKLFLSGQNLVESISGGALASFAGVAHVKNSVEHWIEVPPGTTLGDAIGADLWTTGSEPPLNQNSQDVFSVLAGEAVANYNAVAEDVSVVSRVHSGGGKSVVTGFGIEGVHALLPGAPDRVDLMTAVLDWLGGAVGIDGEDGDGLPSRVRAIALAQNSPNPFNPSTLIQYEIPASGLVRLGVFDTRGNRIRTLVDEEKDAGRHSVRWNGLNERKQPVASGVYFYRLESGDHTETRRMILVK